MGIDHSAELVNKARRLSWVRSIWDLALRLGFSSERSASGVSDRGALRYFATYSPVISSLPSRVVGFRDQHLWVISDTSLRGEDMRHRTQPPTEHLANRIAGIGELTPVRNWRPNGLSPRGST